MQKNYWRNRNVFVTGATGLLGSWVTQFLVEKGATVTIIIRDHIPSSHLFLNSSYPQVNVIKGSIEDYFVIERVLAEYEIDTLFHLAAQTIAPIANNNPLSTFETNIKGTWIILEAARRSPWVKNIIVASSDKAYGDAEKLPYTEKTPLRGNHPYDVSKSCADLIAQAYFVSYKLPVCITRCGNLFGEGDLNFNRLIPSTIRSVFFNERPILRSDGKYIRDYFYVRDAAEGVLLLAETMGKNRKILGEAFNFSNDNPVTVLEMVSLVLKNMKSKLKPVILNESTNEILKQYLSSKKARKVLNWKPKYSLEEGIAQTIAWYQELFLKKI